jgi:hypothetical protein
MTIIQQLIDMKNTQLKTQRSFAGITIDTTTEYLQYIWIAIANSALAMAMKIYAEDKTPAPDNAHPYVALYRYMNTMLMLNNNERRPMTAFLMLSFLRPEWSEEQCLAGEAWLYNRPEQPIEWDTIPLEFQLRCAYKAALSLLREADRYQLNAESKNDHAKDNAQRAMDFALKLVLRIRDEIVAPAIEANIEAVTALINAGVYINNFELEDLLNDARAANNDVLAKRLNKLTS